MPKPPEIVNTGLGHTREWVKNHMWHRLDGPAVEWEEGDKSWYENGKCKKSRIGIVLLEVK